MRSLAILASGSGTNMQAILDAATSDPDFGAKAVVVVSDRSGAHALTRAAEAGIPSAVVSWADYDGRQAFTKAICDVVEDHQADTMVLAGFMRILGPEAIDRFSNRILNIHPALLPAFPGAHAVEEALSYGAKVTGVTVHFVDEQVDHGPVISQVPVRIDPTDDPASLHRRIQRIEHELYPEVIKAYANDRIRLVGRRVVWT